MNDEQDDKTPGETRDLSKYLSPELLQRVKDLTSRLSTPTYTPTQAEVLRALILVGIEMLEKEKAPSSTKSASPVC
jgi:hypothetical protein